MNETLEQHGRERDFFIGTRTKVGPRSGGLGVRHHEECKVPNPGPNPDPKHRCQRSSLELKTPVRTSVYRQAEEGDSAS